MLFTYGIALCCLGGNSAQIGSLPPAPVGYGRIMASGKVLLVEVAMKVIHDVLEPVIIGK